MKNLEVLIDLKEHFVQLKDGSNKLIEKKVEIIPPYVITIHEIYPPKICMNIEYHDRPGMQENANELWASMDELFYGTTIKVTNGSHGLLHSTTLSIPKEYTLSIRREANK